MEFVKMQGAGNDFIIINNMNEKIPENQFSRIARSLCTRKFSLGADGLMFVDYPKKGGDFRMVFYNSDGTEGEMCGNGARCISRYGMDSGLKKGRQSDFSGWEDNRIHIETASGMVTGERVTTSEYRINIGKINSMEEFSDSVSGHGIIRGHYVQLGYPSLPHLVIDYEKSFGRILIEVDEEVKRVASELRYSSCLPKGANVDFYVQKSTEEVDGITYERGVEDFTFACGTGAGSIAYVLNRLGRADRSGTRIHMPGGTITADVENSDYVYITGPTAYIAKGNIFEEGIIWKH